MENISMAYPTSYITLYEETTIPFLEPSSDYTYEDDEGLVIHVFSIVVYSVAFILGTIGNGLVIYFTAFIMKRTVNVVWFLNLAIADFIFTFFLPLSIVYTGLHFHWPFGTFMCKMNSFITFVNLYASILQLTVISIDRCISVLFPVWCQNHRTPRLASFVALAVWILALICSVPYFIFRDTYSENGVVVCFNNFHHNEDIANTRHSATVIFKFIFSFIIPFTIIISCYSIILYRIQRNHMTTSSKPFKVVLAVIISFFICWFPYHVFSLLELYVVSTENYNLAYAVQVGLSFTPSLAFINSCVNPVLYVFMGKDFKEKFHISFQLIFERAFMEESTHTSQHQIHSWYEIRLPLWNIPGNV